MILSGNKRHYDTPIGVLCLDSRFPKPCGHVRNPTTFSFPTIEHVIEGVDVDRLLHHRTPELLTPFIDAARALERSGVEAITGSCGFLAIYQREIAAEVRIPVLLSSLLQVPLLQIMYHSKVRIGVLTADRQALTSAHLEGAGITRDDRLFLQGMEQQAHFRELILQGRCHDMDTRRLEDEIIQTARQLMAQHQIEVLVLECTDLSPFAHAIQRALAIPVFDINTLVEMTQSGLWRSPYVRQQRA